MRFEWFVAQRYLRSPYRPAVLRLVTLFSMIGVAAGVATLVIALSMNTGFRETLQERLLGVTAHVSLTRPGTSGIKNYEEMATKLAEATGARSVTRRSTRQSFFPSPGKRAAWSPKASIPSAREKATKPCSVSSPGNWTSPQTRTALKLC